MARFSVPTKDQVSEGNQAIFDNLNKGLGFVPNLYAYFAKSDNALGDFLGFANRKNSLSKQEQEAINLAVSQINGCKYCQSAHTAIAGMHGYSNEQIIELRHGKASWDNKINALAAFARETATNRGNVSAQTKDNFFNAGYTEENLVDTVTTVGEITITNYLHNLTGLEIDFPLAPALDTAAA